MHVPGGRREGGMDVGVGINPDHPKPRLRMGTTDARNRGGSRGVIAGQHQREAILLKGGTHQMGRIVHHTGDGGDMTRVRRCALSCGGCMGRWGLVASYLGDQPFTDFAEILLVLRSIFEQLNPCTGPWFARPKVTVHFHKTDSLQTGCAADLHQIFFQTLEIGEGAIQAVVPFKQG